MNLNRDASPLFVWNFRAIFSAVSTASEPPLTKNTRESLSGDMLASLAASLAVTGATVPPGV